MNKKSQSLLHQAYQKADELSRHPVLSGYWADLSLVLKGSTARGNADRYSDIDLVFYASEKTVRSIVAGYRKRGLTDRTDGVFVPFANGHYHIESCESLRRYFAQNDFVRCWEAENALALSDPAGRFAQIVQDGQLLLFQDHLGIVKCAYLDIQLDLDWMRLPITRGDGLATFLHAARGLRGLCRIAYLLDARSYPPDKWIARYLSSTRMGRAHGTLLRAYLRNCDQVNGLIAHRPFPENPLYRDAALLVGNLSRFIRRTHGDQPWLDQWYRYV